MDYVEQLQSLDGAQGKQVIFDALNTAALAALSDMKNESTTKNTDFVNVATSQKIIDKAKKTLLDQPNMFPGTKTGFKRTITKHQKFIDSKKLTEDIDQLDESRVIALLKAAKQLGYKHYKDIPEESDDMVKLQELSTKFQNDEEKPVTKEDTDQIDEARKVGEYTNGIHKATIHKEDDEYRVKFHKDGKHLQDADYFTDDKADAEGTAKHQVNAMCNKQS